MKVKHTIKKITKTQRIPMDREMVKYLGEFWGRSIANNTPEEDEKKLTYSIQQNDRVRLEYEFDKDTINRIKNQLSIQEEDTQLNIGRQAARMWLSLIVLAYEQGQQSYEIKGTFTYKDLVDIWNVPEGSKLYSDIRSIFISLSSVKFIQKTQDKKENKVAFYSLINSGEIIEQKNEDEATVFKFVLNHDALGLTADWIRYGKLSKSVQHEGYLSLPVSDLLESSKQTDYLNFRERLRLFPGGEVGGEKILTELIKLANPDRLKRRDFCHHLIKECLDKAKTEKELNSFSFNAPYEKGWLKLWKVTISKYSAQPTIF